MKCKISPVLWITSKKYVFELINISNKRRTGRIYEALTESFMMYYRQDAPTELNAAIEKDVLNDRQP